MAIAEEGAVPAAATDRADGELRPPASVKFFYSIGQVVESGYIAVNGFVFFYYTAVLGLSGSMVGAAVAISMCVDAALDPIIGSWSDSVRSKYGRRLPLMLIGAPTTLLTMGLLFAPPSGITPFLLFVWLTLTKGALRAFASVFNIPYFALGGEMADGYAERSRLVAYRLLGGIVATVVITALAYSVFFAGKGGLQRPDAYPAFGWSIGALVFVVSLVSLAGVWRYAASLPQPQTKPAPMARRLVGELVEIFGNASFRILFLSMLVFASAAGAHAALNNHNYVFVWKLRPEMIQFLTYASLVGITVGVPITPYLLRFWEKKAVVGLGLGLLCVGWTVLPVARAGGWFMPEGNEALVYLIVTQLVVGLGLGFIYIAYPAMMADAAEEHEMLFGHRREGLYFSGLGFAGKAAAGVGTMVGGFALDLLKFPREAGRSPDAVIDESVLAGLVIAWGPFCAALCVLGGLIFAPYAISRARHGEIIAALRRQRSMPH
ncbi:MAG: MFS transporter [Phenylobacterium sp.]|uniref:MFS transporter n=1 Tax=Phenylobacterium sp. TaxID=1871053 RepID=UPI001A3F706C|nr:MFS transporter [Phenylobacterium sp.]MBL8770737.1 MFS transporter [Phenylobacterium sp.]